MDEKDLKDYKLPAHLRKKDGYWHMIIEAKNPKNGKIIRHSKSTKIKVLGKTKKETENNEYEAKTQLKEFQKKWSDYYFSEKKEEKDSQEILFTDYLHNWLLSIKANVEPYTFRNYKFIIERKVIPYFTSKKLLLKNLKAYHLQEFYSYCLNKENLNPNTVIRYHANIRKALHTAFKQELVTSNQADLVDKPRKKRYIANTLPIIDLFKILKEIEGTHLELPTFFSVCYGLRRGETAGLLWSNIDFKEKKIIIGNSLVEGENRELLNRKKMKTKSSYRTLELIPEVENFLLEIKERQEKNKKTFKGSYNYKYEDNICVKENGELIKLGYITQKFKQITRKLGYSDIHFHCLRHSFATNMYDAGMDMKELQMWLGHSSISTTMDLYLHFLQKRIKESARIISEAINCSGIYAKKHKIIYTKNLHCPPAK